MSDFLLRLPPDVFLPILAALDLESLDSLLQASSAAYRLFDAFGAHIFEAVLSNGTTHQYTCALIRITALLRTSSLPPEAHDWKSLKAFVRHESTPHRYKRPSWTRPPARLPSDFSPTVLRGILATYRRTVCLVISCLKFYLGRFRPLRPLHLADESFTYVGNLWAFDLEDVVFSYEQHPKGRPFPVHDIGPPTWVEEQRLLRAFWRLQVFHEVRDLGRASRLDWTDGDLQRLNDKTVALFYDIPPFPIGHERYPMPFFSYLSLDVNFEHQLLWTVVSYLEEDRQTITLPDFLHTRRDWQALVERDRDRDILEP